jgi:hypothetical protein
MRAFHREPNPIKRDEIAARQLHALREHLPRDSKLRLSDHGFAGAARPKSRDAKQ